MPWGQEAERQVIRLRAERKAGKLLKQSEKAQGRRTDLVGSSDQVDTCRPKTLQELGIPREQQLGGDVSVEFSPSGLVCDIRVPLAEHELAPLAPEGGARSDGTGEGRCIERGHASGAMPESAPPPQLRGAVGCFSRRAARGRRSQPSRGWGEWSEIGVPRVFGAGLL
jgi:hypothetical protein